MFPNHLVDLSPGNDEIMRLNSNFPLRRGPSRTIGKAVPKDELKHIGHCLLDKTIDSTNHGYVEWDSGRDYFTVEDGAGRKYESRDFAFAANFLFSNQELLSAGLSKRMDTLAGHSLGVLYREPGRHTLTGNRKGSSGLRKAVIGIGVMAAIGAGIYLVGSAGNAPAGSAGANATNDNTADITAIAPHYPDFSAENQLPLDVAVMSSANITPLDPVKDLGAGKYRIGDTIIDTTDDAPDMAVAYGGVDIRKERGYMPVVTVHTYVDKKAFGKLKYQYRMVELKPDGPSYMPWGEYEAVFDRRDFREIRPGLFWQSTSGLLGPYPYPNGKQITIGHPELAGTSGPLPAKHTGFIVPANDVLSSYGCTADGYSCRG